MTNKEEIEDSSCVLKVVDLLAVNLINQVLDEASVIVNAAKNYDRPWNYVSGLKNIRYCRLGETCDEGLTFVVSKGDDPYKYKIQENIVVTSTPQKTENKIAKLRNEVDLMGQGDEGLEMRGYQMRKSTSMYIYNLFDMSDVERVFAADESDVMQYRISKSEQLLSDSNKNKIKNQLKQNANQNLIQSKSEEYSSYSFLNDALGSEIRERNDSSKSLDIKNNINSIVECESKKSMNKELTNVFNDTEEIRNNNDLALYENAYITMNRDYEQFSEEEEPILKDPKAASMQDIDLITKGNSDDNMTPCQVKKELKAISGISSFGTSSRKSNVVRRFRNQGAKLLSCLRGWWWRKKLIGKQKQPAVFGSGRGLCPLSPDARRRAASLLNQRNLSKSSLSRSVVWKFNTVNEAIVNSSRWKEFDLETNLN